MDDLERAREELRYASETAGRTIQRQVDSLIEGVFEEDEGSATQDEPAPHPDRIAEMAEKLDGLEAETEEETTANHIANARDHLRRYVREANADA